MVRLKNRYMMIQVNFENDQIMTSFDASILNQLVRSSLSENFGDNGYGKLMSSLSIKYMNPWTGVGIVRAARDYFRMLWASLSLITHVQKLPCNIRVVHVSGTIKKCQLKAIDINKRILYKLKLGEKKTRDVLQQSERMLMSMEP